MHPLAWRRLAFGADSPVCEPLRSSMMMSWNNDDSRHHETVGLTVRYFQSGGEKKYSLTRAQICRDLTNLQTDWQACRPPHIVKMCGGAPPPVGLSHHPIPNELGYTKQKQLAPTSPTRSAYATSAAPSHASHCSRTSCVSATRSLPATPLARCRPPFSRWNGSGGRLSCVSASACAGCRICRRHLMCASLKQSF